MSDKRRFFTDQRYVHFLTFMAYYRRKILNLDQPKRIVLGALNRQLSSMQALCVGFVLMPNHVHSLLWLPESDALPQFVHEWKRQSSAALRQWYEQHAPNYCEEFDPTEGLWQPKYHAFQIYSHEKLEEKLDYMHLNPVRRGLVVCTQADGRRAHFLSRFLRAEFEEEQR